MEYEKIKKLMDDFGDSKLTSIDIDFPDGTKIAMKKEIKSIVKVPILKKDEVIEVINDKNNIDKNVAEQIPDGKIVKSPMVGTFYSKPSPESNSYVTIGKKVKKGDILCIIEAMKLMNEIESEFDGEIVEIYVEDGKPVEYGKPLFRIK